MISIDLGFAQVVKSLKLTWKHPAMSVLVLSTPASIGNIGWTLGSSFHQVSAAPTTLLLDPKGGGVLARRIRLYMAHPRDSMLNGTLPVFGIESLVAEACELPRKTSVVGAQLSYQGALTPIVTLVSPSRGSTAGGTLLTLSVSNLPASTTIADVSVTIVGKACVVGSVDAVSGVVTCTTGSYGKTSLANPGAGLVHLTVAGVGSAAAAAEAHYEYIDLWCRRTTWGGDAYTIPGSETKGDSIWIQNGQRILLDCDIDVYMMIIQGVLEFDRKDIYLNAGYIFVVGGSFIVGTERQPFLHKAIITLVGSPVSQEIPVYGAKVLACRFCTLDLHGRPLLADRTHTKLARTARKGEMELWLMEPVDWAPDSQIAITSTAVNGTFEEFDTAILVEVTDGGYRLKLGTPLLWPHLGETKHFDEGHTAEFRADVALLSRNVVVQGDSMSILDKHGCHIILHSRTHKSIIDRSKGESLTARIENIEVRYAGQMGRLGRYSIHFHMIGAVKNSYVRYNSIHHTYQRAVAIHGVHYLRVIGNVAFETMGHTYFVEDGVETKNQIVGNLGANVRELFVGLTSDATPAVYWLVNGDNYVERNIAAGGTHYGIWFFPEPKIRGASEFDPGSDTVCPQGVPLLHFDNNEGHNMGKYGLRIFTGKSPHNGEGLPGFYPRLVDPCAPVSAINTFVVARFRRQFSWRNGRNGITFGSVAAMQIIDAKVADNNMRGMEGTGADGISDDGNADATMTMSKLRGPWGLNKLIRPIFIGHDQPCPACDQSFVPHFPDKDSPLGFGFPAAAVGPGYPNRTVRLGLVQAAWLGLVVENATFINYDRQGVIAVGGFAKAIPPTPAYDMIDAGSAETRFLGTRWVQSPNRVKWRWADEALFNDLDGTFCDHPTWKGCFVLRNDMLGENPNVWPDCYVDNRYDGIVCKRDYHVVAAGIGLVLNSGLNTDPLMNVAKMRISHRNGDGFFVREDDDKYLRDKWRPGLKSYNLIQMDMATDAPSPMVCAETMHGRHTVSRFAPFRPLPSISPSASFE